ncbi:MAG: helix-turn-helix domain-containing protein [Desulfohalobiaceae bacterium]|nr:helix-turn-helix domain-containing protein [Desulfohalobiaceae bacterium]
MDKWLTVEEVANQCQVSSLTVRRWINAGELRAAKLGKSWRIKPEDLDAFYEGRVQAFEEEQGT